MFDHIEHRTESKVVAVTKEIEKTISPDQVTKMYDAVREKVESDILAVYRIESNQLKGIVVVLQNEYDTMTRKLLGRYELNGNTYEMNEFVPSAIEYAEVSYEKLYEHFKSEVARQMIKETVQTTPLFKRL